MTKKGKKIADVGEPSSSKSRVKHKKTKRVKATEEGETSSKTDTRLKTKTRPLKTAKRIITTEEQAERIRVQRRRNFNKNKDVTCKRRGDVKSELEGAPTKFPSLNTRTTPSSLFDELPKLNDAQRQAIQDIGFGSVLSLQVKKLPCRLAYWILEHFDENRCELELEGGIRVKITEDDVYRVYGFPKGSEIIPDFNRCSNTALCEEWVAFFGLANREKIKIGHVLSEMLDCTTGGTWFKRHFMIAMTHSLIQSCTSGTVYPHILRCLENVRTLKKWNWGEYVLRSLVDHKLSWVGDEDKVFSGPTLFLVLFYVDRCELHRKRVEREFPIIKNWTSAALRKRQATEENIRKFGTGSWREPIVLPAEYVDNEQPDGDSNDKDDRLGSRIMKMAVSISAQLEDLRDLIYSASVVDKESSYFLQCVDAAIKITGVKVDMDGPRPWRRPEGMEIDDDPLSYSDELRASVDAACANVQNEKVRERVSTEGIPSFDLDMGTQDEVPIEKDPVEHVPNKEGATMVEDSFAKESAVFEATIYKEQSKEYGMVDDSVAHEAGNGELIEERAQQEPLKESAMVEDSAAHETGTVVLGKSVDGIEQPSKEATEEGFMGKGAMDAVQSKGGCVVKKVVARKADIGKVNEVAKTPPRRSTRVGGAARGKGSDNIDKQLEVLKKTYVRKNVKK
ncbi:uncharacterized protein LOC131002508 [Salvia miltiorrhiza]|uniref:uncharacterized protein LOC131002508 n=1 Tax=Salvia miltiorrhiza TaxID=226208 RepID=UPI0025ABEC0C|nr:uncharacterized protein LOC131002508 [Salvia miltiorrhiza]